MHDKQNNIKYSTPSLPYPKKDIGVYGYFLQELRHRELTSFTHHTLPYHPTQLKTNNRQTHVHRLKSTVTQPPLVKQKLISVWSLWNRTERLQTQQYTLSTPTSTPRCETGGAGIRQSHLYIPQRDRYRNTHRNTHTISNPPPPPEERQVTHCLLNGSYEDSTYTYLRERQTQQYTKRYIETEDNMYI